MSNTVFISSTALDLIDHRAAVAKALLNAGFHPIDMANFMSRPEGATSASLKEVAESDLFVGIYAWRYGFIPEDAEVSITEQEFIEAGRLNKPRFCFLVDEGYEWPEKSIEKGVGARLLREFKSRLESELVRTTFTTPDDLAGKVLASLQRWERENAQKAADTRPPEGVGGATYHVGNIQAAIVNQGGQTSFEGDLTFNLDFSETKTETNAAPVGTLVRGDQRIVSRDFKGANVNIRSTLEDAVQTIDAASNIDQSDRERLGQLLQQLNDALQEVPPENVGEAEAVARLAASFVEIGTQEEPNPAMAQVTATDLRQAAENLAKVVPTLLPIAAEITRDIVRLMGKADSEM
jgi:hypothetical protein